MLEKKTYELLKYLYKKEEASFSEISRITKFDEEERPSRYFSCLLKNHFADYWVSDEFYDSCGLKEKKTLGLKITLDGSAYIERKRKDAFMFWFPYTITTLVAIASLLVAIAGLLLTAPFSGNQGTESLSRSQEQACSPDTSEK